MTQTINSEGQAPSAQASPAVFNNPEFGSVRVIMKEDGEPLFCLKDVCDCLDLSDASMTSKRVDPDEVTQCQLVSTDGRNKSFTFVTESGLYDVIMGSRSNEKTKPFKKWVTSVVLPSIRKTGSYSVTQPSYQIEDPIARAQKWIDEEKERIALRDQNNDQKHIIRQQSDVIDVLLPKAQAYEDQMSDEGWFTGSEAAKQLRGAIFQSGRTELYEFLREKGIFNKSGHPMPSEKYLDTGWFKVVRKDVPHAGKVPVVLFSQKGIDQIYSMLVDGEMKKYIVGLFVGSI